MRRIMTLALAFGLALFSLLPSAPADAAGTCAHGFHRRHPTTSAERHADKNNNNIICVDARGHLKDDT